MAFQAGLSVVSSNAAISACEKGEHWAQALNMLEEMRLSWLAPNEVSYSAAIGACDRGHPCAQARICFRRGGLSAWIPV